MGGYGCHPSFKVDSQQQKEKDFDDVVPRDGFCDMLEET